MISRPEQVIKLLIIMNKEKLIVSMVYFTWIIWMIGSFLTFSILIYLASESLFK